MPSPRSNPSAKAPVGVSLIRDSVSILESWEQGIPFSEAAGRGRTDPLVYNGLLDLFRHLASVRWVLKQQTRGQTKRRLLRVLEVTTSQLIYTRGYPAAVLVDSAVRYVRSRFSGREAGFVNACLRRIAEDSREPCHFPDLIRSRGDLRLACELPADLYRRWVGRYGQSATLEMASLALESATVHARLRAGRSVSTEEVEQLRLVPTGEQGLFSCTDPNAFFRSRAFAEGRFYVQDPATLVAPELLHVHPGEVVADLCAAPGGKALVLGDSLAGTGCLVCMDRSERRLQRLVANADPGAARTVLVGDAARAPLQSHAFDAVLLDVPCSNTGVLRRRPDAKWRFSAGQLAQLVGLQAGILEDAARLVRPGGRLVYSTCSLEPEENGDQVRAFAARHPEFTLTEERALLPDSGHDGAYCALLGRRL